MTISEAQDSIVSYDWVVDNEVEGMWK